MCAIVSSPGQSFYILIPVQLLLSYANKDLLQFRSFYVSSELSALFNTMWS
jgi:hypothetical protein